MAQSGHHGGERAISRHLKVLLPSSSSNSGKLRISDELARRWDGVGSGRVVPVVSPFGKVWLVEVGRDAEGPFLGRGWPEFAAAHGFAAGWFLVLRHEAAAAGVLTVRAFDTTRCLREFGRPLIAAGNHGDGGGASRRPQFINVLLPPSMEKMVFPPRFVHKYIAEPETGSSTMAVLHSSTNKFYRVTVENDRSGNMFFSGGWSRFLASNGIAEYDVLLLRHEGNMVFTVKVFGPDGCQKGCKDYQDSKGLQHRDEMGSGVLNTGPEDPPSSSKKPKSAAKNPADHDGDKTGSTEEEDPPSSSKKRKSVATKPADSGHKTGSKTEEEDPPSSSKKPKSMAKMPADGEENSKRPRGRPASTKNVYEIGPPSRMKMEMSKYIVSQHLMVPSSFCKAIGLQRNTEITLRTNTDEGHGLRSWQVRFAVYANRGRGHLTRGWRGFCSDNGIEEGDVCTFNIVETELWHVDITRRPG